MHKESSSPSALLIGAKSNDRCVAVRPSAAMASVKLRRSSAHVEVAAALQSSKPLPPCKDAVADQNLDCSSDRKPADAEPPSELRLAVDAGGLPDRNVVSEPIE